MSLFLFRSTFEKLPYGCLSVKLQLQRYETEACYKDFWNMLSTTTRNCISSKNLAREMFVLQKSCKLKFHLARILQVRYILQESCKKPARKRQCLARFLQGFYFFSTRDSCMYISKFYFANI